MKVEYEVRTDDEPPVRYDTVFPPIARLLKVTGCIAVACTMDNGHVHRYTVVEP